MNSPFETLTGLFLHAVKENPTATGVLQKRLGRYVPFSYEVLQGLVSTFALRLGAQGLAQGDRFALLAENRLEWLVTDFAALGLGAVTVPLYPTCSASDIEYILRDSESKGIMVSSENQLKKILEIWGNLPYLKCAVVADKIPLPNSMVLSWEEMAQPWPEETAGDQEERWSRFERQAALAEPNQLASILYTSGTTGQPKGVRLTHRNIVSNVLASAQLFPMDSNDTAMSFLPLSHVFERTLDYFYFYRNVPIAYAENLESLTTNLGEIRPTVMAVVPRVFEKVHTKIKMALESAPAWRKNLFSWAERVGTEYYPYRMGLRKDSPSLGLRLRWAVADRLVASKVRARLGGRLRLFFSGSAPLATEMAEFFYAMGVNVYEGYGLTETSPVIASNCPGHLKVGTVGKILPEVEVKIEVKIGEAEGEDEDAAGGEILVRGPNVTPGYYRLEEENKAAFADGWFRTGDLGKLDADGYLTITGRKKNLFKSSGGKYISPEKLENLFQGHPFVAQIVILGDGRKFVSALVVPNFARLESWAQQQGLKFSDRRELVSLPEVATFLQGQVTEMTATLAPYEQIRQIAILSEEFTIASGELSPTQKTKRRVVEERYRQQIEEIYTRTRPARA